jgi:hypothetical protein
MLAHSVETPVLSEEFLARLTSAAYEVLLKHGLKAPFLEVEMGLWRHLRLVLIEESQRALLPPQSLPEHYPRTETPSSET